MNVLVGYASRHGSTRGVAERIASRLGDQADHVDLSSVEQIEDVTELDAIVLGSPVYDQSWLPECTQFVDRNLDALAARQVWLFSVGSFGDTHPLWGRFATKEPKEINALRDAIRPRQYRIFAGVIERNRWPFFSRLLFRAAGGHFGDNRDWPEIDAWAAGIARSMQGDDVPNGG
jgi:menaquinone-dependent protoporphyrinogen oxidase